MKTGAKITTENASIVDIHLTCKIFTFIFAVLHFSKHFSKIRTVEEMT